MRSICHTNHAVVQIILLDLTVSNITQVINHLSKGEKITPRQRDRHTHTPMLAVPVSVSIFDFSQKSGFRCLSLLCWHKAYKRHIAQVSIIPIWLFKSCTYTYTFFFLHELLECRIHGTCSGLMGRLFPPSCHGPRGPELNQAFHNSPKNKKGFVA